MRISLNLFGQVPVEEAVDANVFVTSTTPSQSIKDILSDGTVFHLFRSLNIRLIMLVLCDPNREEYNTIKSFEEDVDKFVEVLSFTALMDSLKSFNDDDDLCVCTFLASDDLKGKPRMQIEKFQQTLHKFNSATKDFKSIFISYSTSKFENEMWIPAINSMCFTEHESKRIELTSTSHYMKEFFSTIQLDTSSADLFGGRNDSALIVCPHINTILFRASIKGVKYEIVKKVDLTNKDFAQWYSDFEMNIVENKIPFDWRASEIANDVQDLVQDLVFEYMRCHRDLDEFFTDAKIHEVEMSLLAYRHDNEEEQESQIAEQQIEVQVVQELQSEVQPEVQPSEVQPPEVQPLEVQPLEVQPLEVQPPEVQPPEVVQPSEVVQLPEVQLTKVQRAEVQASEVQASEVQPAEVQPEVQPEAVQSEVVVEAVQPAEAVQLQVKADESAIQSDVVQEKHTYEENYARVYPSWKQNLKANIRNKFNINLNSFDILLSYLEEGLPYTIIVGSDGIAQALQGALPPQLLQSLMRRSSIVNLPMFDGTMTQLSGDSMNMTIGGITLDVSSMFLVDQAIVYGGQVKRRNQYDDILKAKTNESRGSVTRLTRRIELARLLSKK
jgi:hypothetical protein